MLLSTAVIAALQDAYPGAQVDYLCQQRTAPALAGHPGLTNTWKLAGKGPGGLGGMAHWAGHLRSQAYDAALVLWSTTAMAWLCRLAGIPRRVGQDSRLSYSWLYTHRVKVRSEHGDTESHWSEIMLDYVRALGVPVGPARVFLHIPPEAEQRAAELVARCSGSGPLVGVHAFKGPPVSLERWPLPLFAEWVRELAAALQARIVLTGSAAEQPAALQILEQSGVERAWCVAGETDVPTLAALARRCDLFVCPDSGPMHVAAAAGAKVLGVYALAEDYPQRWAPLTTRSRILRPQPTGCRHGCRKASCPDFRCYRQVSAHHLLQEARQLLAEQAAHAPP